MKKNNFLIGIFLILSILIKSQNPGGVTGSQLWYKADAGITTSAGNVTQWNNSASALYNLVQQGSSSTIPAYNTSQINFNPSVTFDGTDDRLFVAAMPQTVTTTSAAPFTTSQYIVYRKLSNTNTLYSHSNGVGGTWNIGGGANGAMLITNRFIGTTTPVTNEVRLQEIDGNSNAATAYLNGSSTSSTFSGGTASAGTQNFWLGAQGTTGFSNADIAEVVIYNAAQSATSRQQIESYLALKYGITKSGNYIASNGATNYWDATTNTGYNNNITGIARDDNSALYQKQSMSINSGQQLLIGLTGMANSNSANTGTLTDQQFLVVGDNGLVKKPTIAISGVPGANFRFNSVWKVQNTATVGTVRVMWPQGLSNLKLVQNASDPTFTTGNVITDMSANTQTINGVVYNYADVILADGQYFTFAAQVYAPGGVVTGLSLWLKSDAGVTTSGTSVTSWINQAPAGLSVTQATAAKQPVFSGNYMNFNPGINFATNQEMALLNGNPTIFGTANPITAFYLGNSTSVSGSRTVLEMHTGTGDNPTFEWRGTSFGMDIDGSAFQDNGYHTSKTVAANTPYIIASGFNNQNAGGQIYNMFNGAFQDIRNGNAFLSANIGLNIYVGGAGGGEYFQGGLPEVIAYNTYVNNATDILKINSYLSVKYGMTLDQTTPLNYLNSAGTVIWNGTTNVAYNKNIAGIERDDASALHQKQSQSINTGSQVIIGIAGALANTNALNGNSFISDQQSLMWGDNGLSRTPSAAISGVPGTNFRFASVWKVQNTGSVGTVRVMWPQGLNNLKLVQNASDPTFTTGNVSTDMFANTQTINGVVYNYADVTLADGQYFTFAAQIYAPGGVVSGLEAWHKADSYTYTDNGATSATSGQTIQRWNDFNNLGVDFTQATAGNRPTYTPTVQLNFNPTVRFTRASSNFMSYTFASSSVKTEGTMYFATKQATTGIGAGLLGFDNTLDYPGWHVMTSNNYLIYNLNFTPQLTNLIDITIPNLVGASWKNGAGSTTGNLLFDTRYNGFTQTFNTVANVSTTTNIYRVGSDTNYGAYDGNLGESIYYSRDLITSEKNRVDSYLAIKYGTTLRSGNFTTGQFDYLNTSGTTIWNGTTSNSAYHNNVAGIGRDDLEALYQKQSMSANAGQQVLIGLPGMANTNALNTGTLTDGQYLIWGDNGLGKSLSVPITGITGVNLRFAAIWKVQNTSSLGVTRVMWPQGITNLKLIQSTDAVFDNTDTITNMTSTQVINGVTYNYADVTLTDGQFFTFAGLINAPGGVALGLGYWYDAGVTATLTNWSDRVNGFTLNKNGTGAIVLSSGDVNSNYNPFYTFSSTDYAHFTGVITPSSLGRLHTTFAVGAKSADINLNYNHIFRFGNIAGSGAAHRYGLGIDNINAVGENFPTLHYIDSGGTINRQNTTYTAPLNKMSLLGAQVSSVVSGNNKQVGYNGSFTTFSDAITADVYNNMQIGGSVFGFAGRIPEVAYYNVSLSTQDRNIVNSYFAIKYGITLIQPQNYLNSDATIVWNSSTNNAFNNNIFGIVRDVNGNLDQKVSHSINDNSILTASTINNFTSVNSDVSRTSLTDKGFMMFGDNNVHTGTTVVNPVSCPALADGLVRINKTWLVQETGTVGANYYEVDLSSYNINSEISLYFSDDSGFTTNTGISPAISVSGGKAVFYYDFKNGQYFTVVGKVGPASCTSCIAGKQTLQNGQAWFNGGTTAATNNALNNVPLTGTAPTSGALSADVSVTYPSGVEWIPTIFPRMFGKWTQLSRYDNLSGAAGKVSYTVNLKDVSGSKAAKASFQIAGITKLAGQAAVVKVIGYCGADQVTPKLNYAYNSTPALNNLLRRYTIDSSTGTATGTQPYLDFLDYATVNVDFEKPVEKIVIEWTIDRSFVFSKVDFLYIGDMSFVCNNPIEPTPDNVSIIASYVENQLPTCEDGTLKLNIKNNNCVSKTIDINNVLPTGLQYVAGSYVGLGTEAPTYTGQNFLLNDLTVPSGNSYIYVKVRPSAAGTYATHFNYTVDGGINNPNPYRSDDDSGVTGYQDTSITYTAAATIVKPTVTKSVDKCFGTSSTELEYTVNITNNDTNPITNVEFTDNLDADQTYIAGSLVQTNFTANGTAIFDGHMVYISGMSIAPGQTAVVKFKVNTNTSAALAYTDVDGSKYFNNLASVTVDPQSECAAANTVNSNLLKVLACTFCTKNPNTSPADIFTKIGITIQTKQNGWPETLSGGAVALEAKTKGFVITRTTSASIVNPVEGMIIYDTTDNCIKLYNGTTWNCVVRSCND